MQTPISFNNHSHGPQFHKPLVHFLKSDFHKRIYGHWADQLRRFNVEIKYVSKPRNKITDGLSRTLFDEDCTETATIIDMYETMRKKNPQWVWKNGKGGYEKMLSRFQPVFRSEMMNCGTMEGVSRHTLDVMITNIDVDVNVSRFELSFLTS